MRWLDIALATYQRVDSSDAPEEIKNLAWAAKQCFVEAQDLRRCYHQQKVKKPGSIDLLNMAAREHRKGVKAYEAVQAWIKEHWGRNAK